MEKENKYIAICTVYGRTHHSIPTKNQEIIKFESTEAEVESKLEEKINSFISTNPESRITELELNDFYRISEEIIPKKRSHETPLKKIYNEY